MTRRLMLAVVLVFWGVNVFGQTAVTTILTVPETNVQGTFTSGSVQLAPGTVQVQINGIMSQTEAGDPANSARIVLEVSFNGGQTWQHAVSTNWVGGAVNPRGGGWSVPSISLTQPSDGTWTFDTVRVRAVLDIPTRFRVGAVVLTRP